MQFLVNKGGENPPRPDTVVLHFNKRDSQIARNWLQSDKKDMFDDESQADDES